MPAASSFSVVPGAIAQPLVSVWLITYNHEAYVAQAIEGVLAQQTTFPVELIIGEDCSTDGTRAIVQAYQRQHPDRITLFLPEQNLGMIPILRPTYALCRGQYIAMLDGDDYWTDPLKLQKQVDQLQQDATARFSFHPVYILNENTGELTESATPVWQGRVGELCLADFLRGGNAVITLSVLFRNDLGALPDWYYQLPYPDLALYYLLLMHGGTARYLPDRMGVYRVHAGGWFSSQSSRSRRQNELRFLDSVTQHLPHQHHALLRELQYSYYQGFGRALKTFHLRNAAKYWIQLGVHRPQEEPAYSLGWPHRLLMTSLKYTGRLLYRLRIGAREA